MPYAIAENPSIFQHGRNAILCGGSEYGSEYGNRNCWKLDVKGNSWVPFDSMIEARNYATVISMENETYVVGGLKTHNTVDVLKHDCNTWQEGIKIPQSYIISDGCGVEISDTEAMLTGGSIGQTILKVNIDEGIWDRSPHILKEVRTNLMCVLFNNKVIITGGYVGPYPTSRTEIIDISDENEWYMWLGNDMNIRRAYHGMGIISLGNTLKLAAFGGKDNSEMEYLDLDSIEIWNDNSETWELSAMTLKQPKSEFGFATLPIELLCDYL